jgi:hypothetical protein
LFCRVRQYFHINRERAPPSSSSRRSARERERRYLASIKAHPGSPHRFDDLLVFFEERLVSQQIAVVERM